MYMESWKYNKDSDIELFEIRSKSKRRIKAKFVSTSAYQQPARYTNNLQGHNNSIEYVQTIEVY